MNDPDIPRGDRTYRLLCRYFRVDHEKLKGEWLQGFKDTHQEWLEKVLASFLRKGERHETLDSYLKYLPVEAFPLDLLAILIYARVCHEHVAVFVGECYWTTHVDDDFHKCRVFLAYRGELVFDDSCMMTGPEYGLVRDDVMRFRRHLERETVKIYAEEKEAAEREGRQMNKKKITNQIESDSDECDLEQILDNTPEDTVQNKDTDENVPNDREKNGEANDIMQNKSDVEEGEANDIMQNKSDVAEGEGNDIMQNSSDADAENDANYLKQIEKEQRKNKRKLRSSNKKSKKKIEVPPSSRVLHSRNSTPAAPKKYSDVVMDSVEKAKSGNLNISSFRLHRRKRRQRQFVCCCCKQKLSSTSELTKHMKEKHPDYKYTCKKCSKRFGTKNGLYKHVLLHSGKRYSCNTCGKLFYWQCELKDHMRKHTAKPAQHVSCPVRGCQKTYSSKHALQRHTRDDHNPPSVIVCDFIDKDGKVCGKESKTKTLYQQRFTHAHTPGFQARCGEYFPWPKKCNEHQNECTDYGKLAAKKNKLKKEPKLKQPVSHVETFK